MCCDGCRGKLYRALLEVPGVVEAAVDIDSGSVAAIVPSGLDNTVLHSAVSFDKYSVPPGK